MKIRLTLIISLFTVLGAFGQTNILGPLNGDFEQGNINNWSAVEVSDTGTEYPLGIPGGVALPATNAEIIGSSHTRPIYYFGTEDCLNEGADFLLGMGSKVIKIWYYYGNETPDVMYPWNSTWDTNVNSLVEGLEQPYIKEFFAKPFKTFVLNVAAFANKNNIYYWKDGISKAQEDQEEEEFYQFTKALLAKYAGTGKTFILQMHEGDWHTRGNVDANTPASAAIHANMVKWLNARQRGVTKARNESKAPNVAVYHAAEINIVLNSMNNGQQNMVNAVLPYTNLDLVSYSAYDSCLKPAWGDNHSFLDAVRYIKEKMPDSPSHGDNNVYIGEFGIPENEFTPQQIQDVMKNTVNVGLSENCPYIIYWQVYDNERKYQNTPIPIHANYEARGFWLKRPNGTNSWHYNYLKSKIAE